MSQRQRRRKELRRKQAERRGPSKRQVATGATIAVGATLAATGSAQAATITVTNLNDTGSGSLRQAILDANQNGNGSTMDNVVFASGLSGTINVGTDSNYGIYPESPITLQGGPNVDYVVFTQSNTTYGSAPGVPITLSGLTITGGHAVNNVFTHDGGGIYNENAALTVSNSVITNNYS